MGLGIDPQYQSVGLGLDQVWWFGVVFGLGALMGCPRCSLKE